MRVYLVKDDEGAYLCIDHKGMVYWATIIAWAYPFYTESVALTYAQKYDGYLVRATVMIKED